MRLLLVIDHFGLGGAQRQLANLALALQRRGHDIEALVYHPQERHFSAEIEAAGVTIHGIVKRRRLSLAPVRALRRLLRDGGFDAVLGFLRMPCLYTELASLRLDGPPLVVSERSAVPSRWTGSSRFRYQLHAVAARIVVNSHANCEQLKNDFPWMQGKLRTIYNGVDLSRFRPASSIESNGTNTLGPASGRPEDLRLLAMGNTAPLKNAAGLAEALAHHHRCHGPGLSITWAGRAPASAAERAGRDAAVVAIRAGGVEPYWHWRPPVDDPEILLAEHDALVHPSMREGLSNAVCEALACGRPVVAARISDHASLLEDGDRGVLFDAAEPADMSRAMEQLRTVGSSGRTAMGHRGRRFAEENLGIDACALAYEALLYEVVAGPPRIAIVGAFPAPSNNVHGGLRTSCDALLSSSFPRRTDLTLLDTTQASVPAPPLLRRGLGAAARLPRFVWLLEATRPHAVLLFVSGGAGLVEKASYAAYARLRGARVMLFPRHERPMERCRRSALRRLVARVLVRLPHAVLCQGEGWAEFLTGVLGLPRDRCPIVPNWTAAPEQLAVGENRDYVPRRPVALLFMGRIDAGKGVFEMLEAVGELLAGDRGSLRLQIAGEGAASVEARRKVASMGLAGDVEFLGWVDGSRKEKAFAEADIFVLPSHAEGLSNALIEAMAAGLPVVATAVGDHADAVTDGREGLLVRPADVPGLVAALRSLIVSPEARRRMGRAAAATAAQRFTVEPAVRRLCDLLRPPTPRTRS